MRQYANTRVPLSACPCCGKEMDCASPVDGVQSKPVEGDLSVCINCAAVLQFDDKLMLKELTAEDRQSLPPVSQIELNAAVRAVKMLNGL